MTASIVDTTDAWIWSDPSPPPLGPPIRRAGARPSISSKNTTLGCLRSASEKRSRTFRSASPEYFPRQSAPLRWKNVTGRGPRARCAMSAFTAKVFPVPGGPWINTPRPGGTPSAENASGYVRGSDTSSFRASTSRRMPAKRPNPRGPRREGGAPEGGGPEGSSFSSG